MANTASAKKAVRSDARKRQQNDRRRRDLKANLKAVTEGKADAKKVTLTTAYKAIDKALKVGLLKKNTAARRKARIAKLLKA